MINGRYWLSIVGLCLLTFPAATAAYAQAGNYPNKPVMIVSESGGDGL
jgi:hypothetical protein